MPPTSLVTATGLALVVFGVVAAVAWWRGRVDHRVPAAALATAGVVLTFVAAVEPVATRFDPYLDEVVVPDVHGAEANSGESALQAVGLETRTVATCIGNVDPGSITDVRLLDRRLWGSMPRVVVDEAGVNDDARRLWQGAEVVVTVRDVC